MFYGHGGRLDAYGCHNNRKTDGYHCHRGPLAGESFGSKAEMLERLKAMSTKKNDSTPAESKQQR
jgi:hypothetical protein